MMTQMSIMSYSTICSRDMYRVYRLFGGSGIGSGGPTPAEPRPVSTQERTAVYSIHYTVPCKAMVSTSQAGRRRTSLWPRQLSRLSHASDDALVGAALERAPVVDVQRHAHRASPLGAPVELVDAHRVRESLIWVGLATHDEHNAHLAGGGARDGRAEGGSSPRDRLETGGVV